MLFCFGENRQWFLVDLHFEFLLKLVFQFLPLKAVFSVTDPKSLQVQFTKNTLIPVIVCLAEGAFGTISLISASNDQAISAEDSQASLSQTELLLNRHQSIASVT